MEQSTSSTSLVQIYVGTLGLGLVLVPRTSLERPRVTALPCANKEIEIERLHSNLFGYSIVFFNYCLKFMFTKFLQFFAYSNVCIFIGNGCNWLQMRHVQDHSIG